MGELYLSDIIIHIVNILVLFLLLRIILFIPVNRFLTARSERVANQLKDADAAKADAQNLKADYERIMQTHEVSGRKLIRDSQAKATQEASLIVQDARNEAEKLVTEAHTRIANEKALAVAEARTEIALLATDIAGRILKREITATDNKTIAEDYFHEEQP